LGILLGTSEVPFSHLCLQDFGEGEQKTAGGGKKTEYILHVFFGIWGDIAGIGLRWGITVQYGDGMHSVGCQYLM